MKLLLPAVLAILGAGCLDLSQDYQINPDGSGKVGVRMIFAPFSLNLGEQDRTPEEQAKDAAREEIEKAKGVEAWGDVTCVRRPDGKFEFKGTAYFKDLAALKLHNSGFSGFPEKLTLTKTGAGGFSLQTLDDAPAEAPALNDEEVKARIAKERVEYQKGKAFLQGMLAELKVQASFTFAGDVESSACFKKTGPRTVQLALQGAGLMKAVDDLMQNDAFLEKQIRARGDLKGGPVADDAFYEKLFGEKGPPRAATAPGAAPLFDWTKEVNGAKAKADTLMKALGVLVPPPPAAQGGALKSVRVVGVRLIHMTDEKRGIRPLNTMKEGLTFALLAELPGAVLSIKEGAVTKATSDLGEDLLPKRDWDRTLHFPSLSEDKAGVTFDVDLKLPGPGTRGLKEVSGTLTYLVGSRTKDVDLGFTDLASGARGKEFSALIEAIEDQAFDKSQTLSLKVTAAKDSMADVEFFDAGGKKLETRASGSMWGGRSATLSYSLKGTFPAKGRIVAKVWEDLKAHQVPFKVENIDLLGRPLK